MMRGLALRVLLIAAAALALLILAGLLFFLVQSRQGAAEIRLPVPDQALAIAHLVETLPPEALPYLLRATNDAHFQVQVMADPPSPRSDLVLMPAATWIGQRYMAGLEGRRVRLFVALDRESPQHLPLLLSQHRPMAMEVTLKDGRYLLVEARGWATERFMALRLVWPLLVVTILIGIGSLWALRRQIRPLEQLAADVSLLGERLEPLPLPRRAVREVRLLVVSLNALQARILRLVSGRSRMMAAISHDLGSYLTRLRLRAEFIADPTQRDRAVADIAAMEALMVDTLALARLEGDALPMERVNLMALACQVAGDADGGRVQVEPAGPLYVRGRPAALARVLTNLVSNALKYGGRADIRLWSDNGLTHLEVADHGPGIPATERELVLEPFYRCDTARSLNQRGHGLGLAIVADIVHRHNGTVVLGDREGGGLRVEITLPAA